MAFKNDGVLHLPFKDANNQDDICHTIFPAMPSQESNFGALYVPDNGPWITQNMDIVQPPPKGGPSSSATKSLSSHSETVVGGSHIKVPLQPSVRQRTAQACDRCRERKTKCSGHRPVCLRCTNRGLVCEYSARLRLSTRSRFHPGYIRPITDQYSLLNYQPIAATRSFLDHFVDIYEPTMAFDEYQPGYGEAFTSTSLYGLDQ